MCTIRHVHTRNGAAIDVSTEHILVSRSVSMFVHFQAASVKSRSALFSSKRVVTSVIQEIVNTHRTSDLGLFDQKSLQFSLSCFAETASHQRPTSLLISIFILKPVPHERATNCHCRAACTSLYPLRLTTRHYHHSEQRRIPAPMSRKGLSLGAISDERNRQGLLMK